MLARGYFNYWTDEDQLWKRNSNMEDRIQAQHDWLGWGLDAFSGCKNIQTTEASNDQQAQPPAPQAPGVGKGNSLILSTMGKRSKTTQHWGHTSHRWGAWLDPARQSSQEGHCAPTPRAHPGATAVFGYGTGIEQSSSLFIQRITEGINWDIPAVKKLQNRSWAHCSGSLLSVCTRAGTYW